MQLHFEGTHTITATAAHIWERLTNPHIVAASTPGMQSVERHDDHRFKIHSSLGLGIMQLELVLNAEIIDPIPPVQAGLRMRGTAQGSEVEVRSQVRLEECESGTVALHWQALTTVEGPLARLGEGMLGAAARLFTERFWNDFALKAALPPG